MSKADLVKKVYVRVRQMLEALLKIASKHGNPNYYNVGDFKWAKALEENWEDIRQELNSVLGLKEHIPNFQDISEDQYQLTQDDKWKTFFLSAYGFRNETNCEACPRTADLIQGIPGMKTAFFSILSADKKIPPHRGPYKGVLRYHLGLKVPTDPETCGITVNGETRSWREGASLIFDDSFQHEAWNLSDETRVILFVDFVRPVYWPVSLLNDAFIQYISKSAFVQKGLAKQREWDTRFAQEYHRTK